jgi:DNA-binding transcriptional regulator YiaG
MTTTLSTTAERIKFMMETLNITNQAEFGRLSNASRSLVNQWISGRTKNVDPRYAFKIEDNTNFSARWIMLGEGNPKK